MIRFKSPALERTMTRLAQSVAGGLLIPAALFLLIVLTDHGDSTLPLIVRHPFAWVLFWPNLVWDRILESDQADIATLITNVSVYALVTYKCLGWRENRRRLP